MIVQCVSISPLSRSVWDNRFLAPRPPGPVFPVHGSAHYPNYTCHNLLNTINWPVADGGQLFVGGDNLSGSNVNSFRTRKSTDQRRARLVYTNFQYVFDPSFNLTQGSRSDETKRQIWFLVHIFHYSDDTCSPQTVHGTAVRSNCWWYGRPLQKKEVAFGNFNPHSNAPRQPQRSIAKHRTARTKINAKRC